MHEILPRTCSDRLGALLTSAVEVIFIKGGRTAHFTVNIPAPCGAEDTSYITVNCNVAQKLEDGSLMNKDEIVMRYRQFIGAVNCTLKDILQNTRTVGEKALLSAKGLPEIPLVVLCSVKLEQDASVYKMQ